MNAPAQKEVERKWKKYQEAKWRASGLVQTTIIRAFEGWIKDISKTGVQR